MAKTRSFLKWAGGKYNCLEQVLAALPQGDRLIEPFAGSGVVYMNASYSTYLLAESNADLISLFDYLQREGEPFIDFCEQYFCPETNVEEKYYQLRDRFNQLSQSRERAALFLYLNRHGYNGLCRYNSKGFYNVPFGRYVQAFFPRETMQLFHDKSRSAHFIINDFRETFALAKAGDVIYCDPPYVPALETTKMHKYTSKIFSLEDQIALAELAEATAARGIPVIVSNHDTAFTRHHYRHARIKSFPVSRLINCQTDNRNPVKELIAVFG